MFSQHKNDISKISRQISQLRKAKTRAVREAIGATAASNSHSNSSSNSNSNSNSGSGGGNSNTNSAVAASDPQGERDKGRSAAEHSASTSTSTNTNMSSTTNSNNNPISTSSAAASTTTIPIQTRSEEPARRNSRLDPSSSSSSSSSSSNASKKAELGLGASVPAAAQDRSAIEDANKNNNSNNNNNSNSNSNSNNYSNSNSNSSNNSSNGNGTSVGATLQAAVAQGRAALVSNPYPITFSEQVQDKDSRLYIKPSSYPFVLDVVVRLLINALDENAKLKSEAKLQESIGGDAEIVSYIKNMLQREGLAGGQLSSSAAETIFSNFNYYQIIQEQLVEITKLRASLEEESMRRISVENTLQALIEIQEENDRRAAEASAKAESRSQDNKPVVATTTENATSTAAVTITSTEATARNNTTSSSSSSNLVQSQSQNSQSDLDSRDAIATSGSFPSHNEAAENSTNSLVYSPDKTLTESTNSVSSKGLARPAVERRETEENEDAYEGAEEASYDPKEEAEVPIDMLFLEIKISEGVFGTLPVHVNSDAKELAINFVNEHRLESAYIEPLIHYIRNAQEQLVIQLVGALPNAYEENSVAEVEPEPEPEEIHSKQHQQQYYNNNTSQPVPTSTVHSVSSEPDQYRYAKKPNRRRNIPPPPPEPIQQANRAPAQQVDEEQTSYYVSPNISMATSPIPQNISSTSPVGSPQPVLMESGYNKSPHMGAKPISPILSSSLNKSMDRKDSNTLSRSTGGRSTGDVSLNLDELDLSLSPPVPVGKVPAASVVDHSNYYQDDSQMNASYPRHNSYHRYDEVPESQIYDVSLSPQQISQHMHLQDSESIHRGSINNQNSGLSQSYVSPPPPPPPGQRNEPPLLMGSSYLYNKAVEIFDRASSLINNGDIIGAVPLYEYSLVLFEQSNLSPSKLNVIRKEVGYWTSKAAEASMDTSSNSLSNSGGSKSKFVSKTETSKNSQIENHRSPKDNTSQKPVQHHQQVYNKQYHQSNTYSQGTNRRMSRENML